MNRRSFFGVVGAVAVAPATAVKGLREQLPSYSELLKWSKRPENQPPESWHDDDTNPFVILEPSRTHYPMTTTESREAEHHIHFDNCHTVYTYKNGTWKWYES